MAGSVTLAAWGNLAVTTLVQVTRSTAVPAQSGAFAWSGGAHVLASTRRLPSMRNPRRSNRLALQGIRWRHACVLAPHSEPAVA